VKRQQNAFFSLSPPELALATPGLTLSPQESVESLETSDPMTKDVPKGFFKPFFRVKGVNPDGPAAIAVNFVRTIFYIRVLIVIPGTA
jgi:hypothetical protein